MKYLNESVEQAARSCVEELRQNGGIGGVIALDNKGHGAYTVRSRFSNVLIDCRARLQLRCL